MHCQRSQDNPVASCEVLPLPLDGERAENGDTHASTLCRLLAAVKVADTGLIPGEPASIPASATTET
jgi:hypothetical protein